MVPAFSPNEIPFEFENVKALLRFEVVPAERLIAALAVTMDEFVIPNVTLFELLKTTVASVPASCVPAEIRFSPSAAPPPDATFSRPTESKTFMSVRLR
jgi:hypothetical protein